MDTEPDGTERISDAEIRLEWRQQAKCLSHPHQQQLSREEKKEESRNEQTKGKTEGI